MRRRPRIDLGQEANPKEKAQLDRKSKRWAQVNKGRPESENPFLVAIKPDHDNYGDPSETVEQLRARLASLEFGNYPGYFNYRNKAATSAPADEGEEAKSQAKGGEEDEGEAATITPPPLDAGLTDERLGLMKAEWFKGKRVLDIGCNRGHITYAIAKLFAPEFILGIDIDLKIIHMANRDLHLHLEDGLLKQNDLLRLERACKLFSSETGTEEASSAPGAEAAPEERYIEESDHMSLSSYVNVGPLAVGAASFKQNLAPEGAAAAAESSVECQELADCGPSRFPNNILFVEHNYVLARDELVERQAACFDTIVCLSVTKWIHLNYRDEGLKRFLKRIHRHLRPGGLLVLEAQPYDNYYRKRKLSERLRANYYAIKFKPEQIDEFLLGAEVGFRRIVFSTTTEHECAGFKRPLKVFLK